MSNRRTDTPVGASDEAEPSTRDVTSVAIHDLTAEQRDRGWGESPRESDQGSEDDERLLRDRPPHWGE